jgi:predicted Rossmann fold nucleotide-binding protein DprA/Smf involved in DNA uptake
VLAHGLEKASPAQNAPLAAEILTSGGLWLSEHAPGVKAQKHFFVHRNRIQIPIRSLVDYDNVHGTLTESRAKLLK